MAQQYPPAPGFGQYPYYPPHMPHPQHQPMRLPASSYQHSIPNPSGPPPYFNPSRFDGHIPSSTPNSPFPQFPPASFPPEMLRHFASNPPPPPLPSMPPLPYAAAGFAPFSQPHQQPQYANHFSRGRGIPTKDAARPLKIQTSEEQENIMPRLPPQTLQPHSNEAEVVGNVCEDGEVGDEEMEESNDAFADQSSRTISHDDPAVPIESDRWRVESKLLYLSLSLPPFSRRQR